LQIEASITVADPFVANFIGNNNALAAVVRESAGKSCHVEL
jgi:hypothetical protein